MSVHVMSQVWLFSQHGGTELLMLLAIADFADDDGNAYPAVPTLAKKCRMQQRNANYILKSLQLSGELEVRQGEGPFGTNRYLVTVPNGNSGVQRSAGGVQYNVVPPAIQRRLPLQPIADKPSLNHQEPVVARAQRSTAAVSGSRLPSGWTLPDDWRAWAEDKRPDLDVDACAESFADYWRAVPGAKGLKADWLATWRNWVRNQRATEPVRARSRSDDGTDYVFGSDA